MALVFESAHLDGIGGVAAAADLMWGSLQVRFRDDEKDHVPSIDLRLLLTRNQTSTLEQVEKEATEKAKLILRSALDLLEAKDVSTLMAECAAQREAEQKAADEWMKST